MRERLDGKRAAFIRAQFRVVLMRHKAYEPVALGGRIVSAGERGTHNRVVAVLDVCETVGADTVLDFGCAEGFLVRRCAESGRIAYGVDADATRLLIGQQSMLLDGVDGFGLIKSDINLHTVPHLPDADVTVCLSVMHHVMHEHGVDYARQLLEAVRRKTSKALVFEMGQSNEHATIRASGLPDMGIDPHQWIAEFIESAGFTGIQKLCETPSYHRDVQRATFVATP